MMEVRPKHVRCKGPPEELEKRFGDEPSRSNFNSEYATVILSLIIAYVTVFVKVKSDA